MNNFMDDVKEDFAQRAEQQNQEILAWEAKIEELYKRANNDLQDGAAYADSLLANDKSLDKWQVSNLHTIVGEIYYDNDSIDLALERFRINESLTFDSPRNKANKAGCYVKQGDLDKAMALLQEAAEVNHDFKWFIGNLYEIQEKSEKAKSEYQYLYEQDTIVYAYCNQRIQELENNPDQLLAKLHYKDRRKRTSLLLKEADNGASDTEIGRFEIEKKEN